MLIISGSYQNYPNEAVSIQLTDGGKWGECAGGGVVTEGMHCTLCTCLLVS
jgi:hypothetical protein